VDLKVCFPGFTDAVQIGQDAQQFVPSLFVEAPGVEDQHKSSTACMEICTETVPD